jgi:F-box and leucine-rich repeat protein 2/20
MRLLVVAEFTRCVKITDRAFRAISSLTSLRVLTLDGCISITDESFEDMGKMKLNLEVLSLAGVTSITDQALVSVGRQCRTLTTLNVCNCVQITSVGLIAVARGCPKLSGMLAAATQLNDDGLATMASLFSKRYMSTLDISFCRDVSDHGIGK